MYAPRSPSVITSIVYICLLTGVAAGCSGTDTPPDALGTLERDRIDLIADSSEPIARILVTEGQVVSVGDPLVITDASRASVALKRAQADELAARSALMEAESGPRQQQIEQARSRLRAAESITKTARIELDRAQALVDRQLISRNDVDITQGKYEEALAKQAEITSALDELLAGTRSEEIDQARARHAAAVATVENLQITLDRATLAAPVNGRIEALPFEIGERPPAGATVVSMLADGPTYARIHISASVRGTIATGAPAEIAIDGADAPLKGRLRWVSAQAAFTPYFALNQNDRSQLSYAAEVDVVGGGSDLPIGIPVVVTFNTPSSDD
jgi:HlyD family secretion protein